MAEFKYEITEHIATISPEVRGWTKELKLISWNGMEPKYDIRSWTEDGSRMGKGISLTKEELMALREALNQLF